jgi:WD40 repeat protein
VFSRDGELVLVFRANGDSKHPTAFDVRDGRTLRHIRWLPADKNWATQPTSYLEPLLISSDDSHAYLAWALSNPTQTRDAQAYLDVWDLRVGTLHTMKLGARGMFDARLSGRNLTIATQNRLLTLDAGTLRQTGSRSISPGLNSEAEDGALSPDGRTLALGAATGAVSFLDLGTGRMHQGSGKNGVPVQAVGYSPSGSVVLTTDEAGRVTVWDPRTHSVVETFTGHEDRVLGITFSGDGRTAYTCSLDGAIFAWDLSGKHRFGQRFALRVADDAALPVPSEPPLAVSPDSKEFATRLQATQVGLFAVSSLRREATIAVPAQPGTAVQNIAWSPHAPLLAVVSSDGTLRIWNVGGEPRLMRTLRGSPKAKDPLWGQAMFSPDGTRLLEAGFISTGPSTADAAAAMWRVSDGKLLWRRDLRNAGFGAPAFADDGRTLALDLFHPPAKSEVQVVNEASGAVEHTLTPLGDTSAMAFAPDGKLVTGTDEGIVQTWNVAKAEELGRPVLAVPAPVSSLAFQPNTDVFATGGGSGGFVKLWDAKTLAQIGSAFPGSPGRWANAVFTPDGSHVVTIYDDGKGAVWPVTVAAWKAQACKVAGRNFSLGEWTRFVGGRTYSAVCPEFAIPRS